MFEETKVAVKKAFEIGKILFSLGTQRYNELLETTSRINPPTLNELNVYVEEGLSLEDATITILRERYIQTALGAGFTEKQGLAILEYAALVAEMEDDDEQIQSNT